MSDQAVTEGTRAPERGVAGTVGLGVVACLLGWLLAAPMEHSFGTSGSLPYLPDNWAPAYQSVYEAAGEPLGLAPYYFWGKFAFLLYVAGLLLARGLPAGASGVARVGRRMLQVALLGGLLGDVLAYWGGWGHEEMTPLTSIGFVALEVPAMLVMLVALCLTGVGLRRDGMTPGWAPWVLVGGAVLTLPFSLLVIGYVPHGVLIPVLATLTVAVAATKD